MNKGVVIVVSGPAGTGKGTIVKKAIELSDKMNLSVSLTTRSPRPGEQDGKEYFFVTKEEFMSRLERGLVLEYTEYCGNYYGTPADYVNKLISEGQNVILEIETDGAGQIKKLLPDAVTVFVLPEKKEMIRERLTGRGTETPEVIEKRLMKAEKEIILAKNYDYLLINRTGLAQEAAKELIAIAESEQHRISRNADFLDNY